MPAQTETRDPILDRDGFSIREDHTTFTILRSGKVFAEPDDAVFYIVDPKDYPQAIKDEFERRQQLLTPPTFIDELRESAERYVPRYDLHQLGSIETFYQTMLKAVIRKAAGEGQRSVTIRLMLSDGTASRLPQQKVQELRRILDSDHLGIDPSSVITESSFGKPGTPRASYIAWTISW